MARPRHFPNRDRLSVLTAVIVLAYALARFLELPARTVRTTLFGTALGFELSGSFLLLVLAAALISAGSDTLIRAHPYFASGQVRSTVPHWVLPGATGLVLGAALNRLPDGPYWWLGLGASAVALMVVLVAEYSLVDPSDAARDTATLALIALTYSLTLVLFILLRTLNARAAISASVGGLVAATLAGRLFVLRGAPLSRASLYAGCVGLICVETLWALNYWRITATSAGLLAMVPFYLGVGVAHQHLAGRLTRRVWIEYAVVGLIGLGLALSFAFVWSQ
jgi:hypothetical protein